MGSPNASTCRVRWPRRANGGVSPRCPPSRTDTKLATARARISAVRRHQTSRRFPQSGTASAKFLPVTEKVHGDQTSQKKNMTEPHAMTGNGDATADSRSPQETVLVTGGSGFLGSWTVVELLRRTYSVRTTIRDLTRAPQVRAMVATEVDPGDRLRFVQADLLKDQGWDEATADADFVLHVASPMPVGEFRGQDVITPAREGTLRVLRAARKAAVKRVVITSSTAAAAPPAGSAGVVSDETFWTDLPPKPIHNYARSKTLAEQDAWAYVRD